MKPRIDEELVSIDALKFVLCTRYGCEVGEIHREEDDPPDFSLLIDGRVHFVEVTSIVEDQQYYEHCKEFVRVIRRNAISTGSLSGQYALVISRLPTMPTPNSHDGSRLVSAALAYLRATEHQEVSPRIVLASEELGKIAICKISGTHATVDLVWIPPGKWGSEIQNQVTRLIQNAIDNKKRKLQAKILDGENVVLALYDAFGYSDQNAVHLAFQQVTGYDWFHSLFWAHAFSDRDNLSYPREPGRDGFFLYSRNRNWSEK